MTTFKKLIISDLQDLRAWGVIDKIWSITVTRYTGGSSVTVRSKRLTDSERITLDNVCEKYRAGHFDAMTESTVCKPLTVCGAITASFVFIKEN